MKNLPLGVQTFRDFIELNYLYVDKTKDIYDLFAKGGKYAFLSRPRRFGKSVLVSTLAEIFSGKKQLFKGLWIYDKIEWIKHPVIHIDFSKITFKDPNSLEQALEMLVEKIAEDNHIKLDPRYFLKEKFGQLIEKMSGAQQQKVVILIDEYDKPMIQYVEANNTQKALEIRDVLKNFYSVIKGSDEFLRFVLITGVSKFSRVSIFSDLNNLDDLTLQEQYSTIVGYTQRELEHYFSPYIDQLAKKRSQSKNALMEIIKKWYDGYSWDAKNFVYNPFSIVNLFKVGSFENFWFATGTPTFLINILKERQVDLLELENLKAYKYTFDSFKIENISTSALLFQTGYLTVKKITIEDEDEEKVYSLDYPNYEVKNSFLTNILDAYTQEKKDFDAGIPKRIGKAIKLGNMEGFIKEIKALFASIPYHLIFGEKEAYYHTVIYLILTLAGAQVRCEEATNKGRIDAVVETENRIYIIEFKMGTAAEAIAQIKEKKYYEKYQGQEKEIFLLGIGFDSQERNIGNYLLESL